MAIATFTLFSSCWTWGIQMPPRVAKVLVSSCWTWGIQMPPRVAKILVQHFATIGDKLASQLPSSKHAFNEYLKSPTSVGSFSFSPITPKEIQDEIELLPYNKACGLYSFPTRILKLVKSDLSIPLSKIMNRSIEIGKYPNKLKYAKIIPIYKDDDKEEPGNYRPISLLSNVNEIYEKLMYNRIISFMQKNNTLYSMQYGFREKHSTQHALLDIVSKIQKNMGNKLFSCGIFIDLQKAFDTVNHTILLSKLNHYAIRGVINNWFCSYLNGRSQTTQINSKISNKEHTLCGVPQGSVLGPVLFLIYINDMHYSSNQLQFFLFADDTNLLYADKNLKPLEKVVNKELKHVSDWLTANKLTLNIKKSNFVVFHPYQKKLDYTPNLKIFDHKSGTQISLESKTFVKYLGILLDNNLSWKAHIDYISLKISKTIGILSRLKYYLPLTILLNVYRTLIYPYLTYGLVVWGQAAQKYLNKTLILQKRVLRIMNFSMNNEHAVPLFITSNVLPIKMLYYKSVSILMHEINNNITPPNITNLFNRISSIHSYNTRASKVDNFYYQYSRLRQQKRSFSSVGTKIWNNIPYNLRKQPITLFKKNIHRILLQVLVDVDSYVDFSEINERITKIENN